MQRTWETIQRKVQSGPAKNHICSISLQLIDVLLPLPQQSGGRRKSFHDGQTPAAVVFLGKSLFELKKSKSNLNLIRMPRVQQLFLLSPVLSTAPRQALAPYEPHFWKKKRDVVTQRSKQSATNAPEGSRERERTAYLPP